MNERRTILSIQRADLALVERLNARHERTLDQIFANVLNDPKAKASERQTARAVLARAKAKNTTADAIVRAAFEGK